MTKAMHKGWIMTFMFITACFATVSLTANLANQFLILGNNDDEEHCKVLKQEPFRRLRLQELEDVLPATVNYAVRYASMAN